MHIHIKGVISEVFKWHAPQQLSAVSSAWSRSQLSLLRWWWGVASGAPRCIACPQLMEGWHNGTRGSDQNVLHPEKWDLLFETLSYIFLTQLYIFKGICQANRLFLFIFIFSWWVKGTIRKLSQNASPFKRRENAEYYQNYLQTLPPTTQF